MTPALAMHDLVNGFWVQPKATGNAGATFSAGVFGTNVAHRVFGQFAVAIRLTRLDWRFPKSKSVSVACVFLLRTPFKILDSVIGRIAVFMIDKRQSLCVRYKRHSNEPVNEYWKARTILRQIHAQMCGSSAGWRAFQHGFWLHSVAAIEPHLHRLGVRDYLTCLSHRVQTFKTRYRLHTPTFGKERGNMIPHKNLFNHLEKNYGTSCHQHSR